mgnify:CR=1 FL=1
MKVELIHNTPLWVASKAIRKCWASEDKSDTFIYDVSCDPDDIGETYKQGEIVCGTKDKALIDRVGNKNKHKSTLEHLVYTFDIDGISRACLQEVARHRMASYSVKSTRYTLKELRDEEYFSNDSGVEPNFFNYCIDVSPDINQANANALDNILYYLESGKELTNDKLKYLLPEAYKTSLVMTINARSLQNFLELRSSKEALWEIRDLANAMYQELPDEHKYLFKDFML